MFCIVFYNNIQGQCVGSQTASMSPAGPYSAGQVVTVTYTLSSFNQLNINWIIAFDIDYGVGWSSISQVSAPGNPGGSGGSWIWDTQNTYPSGLNFGPGYRFQNNGNANWGTSSTGPFTLSFQLVVGSSCTAADLSIDLNVFGDCQTGGWNNGSCCTDPSYSVYTGNSIPTNNNISILDNTLDISCYGSSDGSISLNISSGISPFTYDWSNGFITAAINNLIAGSYDVIVTDATGCSAALNIIINQASTLVYVLNTNDATCFGSSDGNASIDLQASPTPTGTVSTLSYCSSNPNPNLAGPYTNIEQVQLNGDNNDIYNNTSNATDFYEDYSATMYADITEGLTYSLNIAINDMSGTASYSGGVRVFIDFNIDGDFTDLGEDIGIVPTPANLGVMVPISFTVPTTGFYGATRMRIVCQDQNSIISSNDIGPCDSPAGFNMPYFGATEDYSIVLNNPVLSATYLWSTNQTNDSIFGLSAGNYSVTITDDNGCLTIENFTISSAIAITVSADFDQLLCEGIFPNPLSALGSTSGNNYSWTPASDFVNATNQSPVFSNALITTTSYMVTFTDFNGCVATDSVTITVFPTLTTDPINHN